MTARGFMYNLRNEAARVGYSRALQTSMYSVAKRRMQIRRIEVIYLRREDLSPLDPQRAARLSCRVASEHDLQNMREDSDWRIGDELIERFLDGDSCLLSFVGGELGGYTWIHDGGRPEILPGFRIQIPDGYVYNYAGFTLPAFRGFGLQSYRHHQIFERPKWSSHEGLIGYVETTNWSSKKGQSKSGYRKLDELTLMGHGRSSVALLPRELRDFGIRRLHD